jgi:DNA-binding transcriptional LysR family regulator
MNENYGGLLEKGLSMERLVTLCRVLDVGGLSKAAKGNPSQLSLYSRQIKDLESYFGVQLTRKVGRTIEMTDAARTLAAQARGYFREVIASRAVAGKAPLVLTIGASHSLFEWWLIPRLKRIVAGLPKGTRLRWAVMRSAELASALDDRQLDVALIRDDAVPRGMGSKPLLDARYTLFVPKSMATPECSPVQLLQRVPLALAQGGQFRSRFDAKARRSKLKLNVTLDCPSFTLAAQAAQTGQYAAFLPDFARESLRGEPLVAVDMEWKELTERKIVVAWHPRAPDTGVKALTAAIFDAERQK